MKQLFASFALAAAFAVQAQPAAPVQVEGAWARPSVQGQLSSGAYMTLTAREPLTLLGASTPAAGMVELHEMKMDGDVMRMRSIESLPLAPQKPVRLAPGGYHLMMMDLKMPFRAGTSVPITLRFRDAKGALRTLDISVPIAVAAPDAGHRH